MCKPQIWKSDSFNFSKKVLFLSEYEYSQILGLPFGTTIFCRRLHLNLSQQLSSARSCNWCHRGHRHVLSLGNKPNSINFSINSRPLSSKEVWMKNIELRFAFSGNKNKALMNKRVRQTRSTCTHLASKTLNMDVDSRLASENRKPLGSAVRRNELA